MKKILTFLVMLLCSVSMLMAQSLDNETVVPGDAINNNSDLVVLPTAPKAMFPYQAVVRDMTNERNLVVNDTVKIVVEIKAQNSNDPLYTETFEKVPTNFNGLVSIVLGKNEQAPKALSEIDWSTSPIIKSTFYKNGVEISMVETPVMAVPYALQADNAPVELTTKEICRYLADPSTKKSSVDSVIAALVNNTAVSQRVKDTIINYIKTQKATVKELAYYFLSLATPEDLYDALNHTPAAVKSAAKDTVINYIKAHKDEAMDILAAYLQQVTKNDVVEMMNAIRENDEAELILDTLVKYTFNYITSKPALMQKAYEKIVDVVTAEEFAAAFTYVREHRTDLYNFIVNKFYAYMEQYLNENHYLKNCANNPLKDANNNIANDICPLISRIESLENSVSDCPAISEVTATKTAEGVQISVRLSNVDNPTTFPFTLQFSDDLDNCFNPNADWAHYNGVYTRNYTFGGQGCNDDIPSGAKVIVTLTASKAGCTTPEPTEVVIQ